MLLFWKSTYQLHDHEGLNIGGGEKDVFTLKNVLILSQSKRKVMGDGEEEGGSQ